MKNQIATLLTGGSGLGALEIIQQNFGYSSDPQEVKLNLIMQIVVSLATLFGLFKKRKKNNNQNY